MRIDSVGEVPVSNNEIHAVLKGTLDSPFFHPSVMFRRSAVVEVGGYRGFFANAEDYDLWLRLSPTSAFCNIPIPLTRYRLNTHGASLRRLREQRTYALLAKAAFENPTRNLADLRQEVSADADETAMRMYLQREYRQHADHLADLGHPREATELLLRP